MGILMKAAIGAAGITVWATLLGIFRKLKNQAAYILTGMGGLFIILFAFARPAATEPMAQMVAALAGAAGRLTGAFTAYLGYAAIFVPTPAGAMTLQVDLECSGVIEAMAYVSIMAFYKVYSVPERAAYGALGLLCLIFANALRIAVIALCVHAFGEGAYQVAHTYLGRFLFYGITVVLYFYAFTKPHVDRMKVGKFSYGG